MFASDVLKRAVQKDIEVRGGFNEAIKQKATELRAQGISSTEADSRAAEIAQSNLVDRIAAKVKAQFQKNMGFESDTWDSAPLLHPKGAPSAPATGDRQDTAEDGGDEFRPNPRRPGRRPYDNVSAAHLLRGLR
jgi:hypothetical protein